MGVNETEYSGLAERLRRFDFRTNLVVDPNNPILIQKAWRDHFSGESYWQPGKDGGKAYLGVLHGEDAMTWNVFRSLQLEGPRGLRVISDVLGLHTPSTILFWGCDVDAGSDEQQILNILIRTTDGRLAGTMTEPDIVVLTETEVAFVECKLNRTGKYSPWRAQLEAGARKRMEVYEKTDKKEFGELLEIKDWPEIYQLIRQFVYASLLANELNKEPLVIPLINAEHTKNLRPTYDTARCPQLRANKVMRDLVTWQAFLHAIERSDLKCKRSLADHMKKALEESERKSGEGASSHE